jgi:hypothetical protein
MLGAIAALVLTRSLYHVVLLAAAVAAAVGLAGDRRRVLVAGLAIALLPAAWYAKNSVQYGFFGGSSWYGMGLWRVALFRYRSAEVSPLIAAGVLDPVVVVVPFSDPSEYRRLGYTRTSDVPALARDDRHNINIPAISAGYDRSAGALIRRGPLHFLVNVAIGYGNFAAPSTEYPQLAATRERMALHVGLYRAATLFPLVGKLDRALPVGTVGSAFALLIPAGLAVHGLLLLRRRRARGSEWLREEAPLLGAGVLILYTTLIGSAFELGENVRFKFMIEPLLLTYWVVVGARWWRGRRAPEGAPLA